MIPPFTAVTRVRIPSGTPNHFKYLHRLVLSGVGTDGHNNALQFASRDGEPQRLRGSPSLFRGHKWAQVPPDCQFEDSPDVTNNLTTALWAWRFCSVIAWVYVSRVTLAEACLNNSCMTLISAPVARKRVEWVPKCGPADPRLMPSFTAAGRTTLRIMVWPQYGRRPRVFGLAKTQSSGGLYFECASHAKSASARTAIRDFHSDDVRVKERQDVLPPAIQDG